MVNSEHNTRQDNHENAAYRSLKTNANKVTHELSTPPVVAFVGALKSLEFFPTGILYKNPFTQM